MSSEDIEDYIRDCLEPDGSNAGEVIADACIELGVTAEEVTAVYDRMTRL